MNIATPQQVEQIKAFEAEQARMRDLRAWLKERAADLAASGTSATGSATTAAPERSPEPQS